MRDSNFVESRVFKGHSRSVKTAAFRKTDPAVFATGGRDGAIYIWDTRTVSHVGSMSRADNCILSGHAGGPGKFVHLLQFIIFQQSKTMNL